MNLMRVFYGFFIMNGLHNIKTNQMLGSNKVSRKA